MPLSRAMLSGSIRLKKYLSLTASAEVIDAFNGFFEKDDLAAVHAGHQNLMFAVGIHSDAPEHRDPVFAAGDQRFGDLGALVADHETQFCAFESERDECAGHRGDPHRSQPVKHPFETAQHRRQQDDRAVADADARRHVLRTEPFGDDPPQQFSPSAESVAHKQAASHTAEHAAAHRGDQRIVRNGRNERKQLRHHAEAEYGRDKLYRNLFSYKNKPENKHGNVEEYGTQPHGELIAQQIDEGGKSRDAARNDAVRDEKHGRAARICGASRQHRRPTQGFPHDLLLFALHIKSFCLK